MAYAFDTREFWDPEFAPERFLSRTQRSIGLEELSEQLTEFGNELKAQLVVLVNRDYDAFIGLAGHLEGVDPTVEALIAPIEKVLETVSAEESRLKAAIDEYDAKLAERLETTTEIQRLKEIVRVASVVEEVGRLLDRWKEVTPKDPVEAFKHELALELDSQEMAQAGLEGTKDGLVIEHVGDLLATLKDNSSDEVVEVSARFVDVAVRQAMAEHVEDRVWKTLEGYSDSAALYAKFIEQLSISLSIDTLAEDLDAAFELIARVWGPIISATQTHGSNLDILSHVVWVHICDGLLSLGTQLFASGMPEIFHKHYVLCRSFQRKLEGLCISQEFVSRFRKSSAVTNFMSRWNLEVYFRLRYRSIASLIDETLGSSLSRASSEFKLVQFETLANSLLSCFDSSVFLEELTSDFLQLFFQLSNRLSHYVTSGIESNWTILTISELLYILSDIFTLVESLKTLSFTHVPKEYLESCSASLDHVLTCVGELSPSIVAYICTRLAADCIEPIQTNVPKLKSLYRVTSTPSPTSHSAYTTDVVAPLTKSYPELSALTIPSSLKSTIVNTVTSQVRTEFGTSITAVLEEVEKTEATLSRLKSTNKKAGGSKQTYSEKVRLQLELDVKHFESQLDQLSPSIHPESKSSLAAFFK